MDQPTPAQRTPSPSALAVALVMLVVGTVAGYAYGSSRTGSGSSYDDGYEQARQDIRARMEGRLGPSGEPAAVTSIAGTITAIEDDVLILTSTTSNPDPTMDPYPTTRRITVTEGTLVRLRTQKTSEQMAKDLEAFRKERETRREQGGVATEPLMPPSSFEEKDAAAGDLMVGMTVDVTAASDIAYSASFDAVTIVGMADNAPAAAIPTTPAQ